MRTLPPSVMIYLMLCSSLYQVGLWVFGSKLNVDAVTAAILGLSVLLISGVVTWKECLAESVAWDTLTWFAALIAMAGYLNKYGLISWFSQTVVKVGLVFFLHSFSLCIPFLNYGSTAEFLLHPSLMRWRLLFDYKNPFTSWKYEFFPFLSVLVSPGIFIPTSLSITLMVLLKCLGSCIGITLWISMSFFSIPSSQKKQMIAFFKSDLYAAIHL